MRLMVWVLQDQTPAQVALAGNGKHDADSGSGQAGEHSPKPKRP